MIATTRLGLDTPQGTDAVSAGPTDFSQSLGVLDNAAITSSGTLAARPTATSVVTGYFYVCTDVGAAFVSVSISGTNAWQFIPLNGSGEPVGTVKQYAGASVPADPDGLQRWHLADGSAISRTVYAACFSALGTAWGAGDGSTTFNIPDLRGKVAVGAGSGSGLTTHALATSGGEEAHTTTTAEIPAHAHPVTDPGHTHSLGNVAGSNSTWAIGGAQNGLENIAVSNAATSIFNTTATGSAGAGITATNNNTGGGGSHNNMQPFAALNHVVKIL